MEKKKVILLFGRPQECGNPYVSVIRLSDGQVDRTIDLSGDYWDSGDISDYKTVYTGRLTNVEFTTNGPISTNLQKGKPYETLDGDKGEIMNVSVQNEEKLGDLTFIDVKLTIAETKRIWEKRFSAAADTFRKHLEEQGINMKGWCVYKRRKHAEEEFLKAVIPYEDEEVVNFIYC